MRSGGLREEKSYGMVMVWVLHIERSEIGSKGQGWPWAGDKHHNNDNYNDNDKTFEPTHQPRGFCEIWEHKR